MCFTDRQVVDKIPKAPEPPRVPDISVKLFWKIVHATPDHVRAAYVVIAALGLDTGEYLRLTKRHLKPNTFAVEIPGKKTYVRHDTVQVDKRLWGWIEAAVPAPVQYKWLRIYWKRALAAVGADTTLRLKDLRHFFGQQLTNSGRPEASVQRSMRHHKRIYPSQSSPGPLMGEREAVDRHGGKSAMTFT